jgi:hypothetical protein
VNTNSYIRKLKLTLGYVEMMAKKDIFTRREKRNDDCVVCFKLNTRRSYRYQKEFNAIVIVLISLF